MDPDGPRLLPVVRAQPARPGNDIGDSVRPLAGGDVAGEVHQGAVRRRAGTVPGVRPADDDLDLDDRQQPVDVGPFEQPDLEQSHGPDTLRERTGKGASGCAAAADRLVGMATPDPDLVPHDELAAIRASVERAYPAFLRDLERLVNVDCGSYTKAGVDVIGRWTAERLRTLGFTVTAHANDLGLGETVIGELRGTDPTGPPCCASATWTPCSTRAAPPSARSRSRAGSRPGLGSRT